MRDDGLGVELHAYLHLTNLLSAETPRMEDEEIARLNKRSKELIKEAEELIEKSQAVIDQSRRVKNPAGEIDKPEENPS